MKITDGLLHEVFNDIAKDYPQIKNDHHIIDIATARVASKPQNFDVIVTTNLYGDIISDVAAEISGSVGLAGSANIGQEYAMFEAIHGSAPDIANKDIANPIATILSLAMMFKYSFGYEEESQKIELAVENVLEKGYRTRDISSNGSVSISCSKMGDLIIDQLNKLI